MLLFDNLFDRFVARLRRTTRQEPDEFSMDPNQTHTRSQRSKRNRRGHGMFNNAHDLVMNHPTFVDRSQNTQIFAGGKPVLDLISPYTDPDAAVDSSARFPPPLCHPGTRLKIGGRLLEWLTNPERQWNMIWLNGPAATGKSAVAQSFAERCVKEGRLGAAFFFSRPNKRNDPNTVIPSLIYQLSIRLPAYKSLVATQLAKDPQMMSKARHIQFKQLIVDPFLQLQSKRRERIREPLLIVLDGLDECRGEDAQRDIIDMISEASRLKENLPLLWLIVSRPEAHLKHIFSQPDYTVNCGHEELAIDAESITDVDLYIQDGLAGIKVHFLDATSESWPPQEQATELLEKASGHFGFASTALRYIGDETYATPMARLDGLLSFLKGVKTGMSNPLEPLDALYTAILRDIPNDVLQITKQILGHYNFLARGASVQLVCNFWHIDQATFYSAFRKLHSVIGIPTPEAASKAPLRFYHASFEDYLQNPHRSDRFIIVDDICLDYANLCFSWMKTDVELFHIDDSPLELIQSHEHGALSGLKWVSDGSRAEISSEVAAQAWYLCWWAASYVNWDEDLLSQIHNFDFRYGKSYPLADSSRVWYGFVNKLWGADSTSGIIRTEPRSDVDFRLLEYMKSWIEPGVRLEPATFPLQDEEPKCWYYFLVGHGPKAIACWYTGRKYGNLRMMACGSAPSKEGIDGYKAWLIGRNDIDEDSERNENETSDSDWEVNDNLDDSDEDGDHDDSETGDPDWDVNHKF